MASGLIPAMVVLIVVVVFDCMETKRMNSRALTTVASFLPRRDTSASVSFSTSQSAGRTNRVDRTNKIESLLLVVTSSAFKNAVAEAFDLKAEGD